MRKTSSTVSTLFAMVAAAGLMSACNDDDAPPAPPPPSSTTSTVTLTGIVSKGLMANADVAVLGVNADGSVAGTALASTTTNASGAYSLTYTGTAGAPYVIRVSAKADGSTTHLDEIRGTQALPAAYQVRALTIPAAPGPVTMTATITPFSEMAAAAAGRATGGITAVNAAQANSTIAQLLGFDPIAAPAPSNAADASTSAQQLAMMLTAVSRLAADGALGCTAGTAAEQTLCVTAALAASSATTTLKLQNGSTDVSAILRAALSSVLADPALAGGVAASTLIVASTNLACTGDACNAAPPSDPALAQAILASKQLFTEIRSDFASLFSRGGVSATAVGAANVEAWRFSQALSGMQVPVDVMAKSLGVVLTAADLYNDFMDRRTTENSRGGAPGEFSGDSSFYSVSGFNSVACALYADTTNTVLATRPEDVVQIGCRALYFVTRDLTTGVVREWRHGFTIVPGANNSFSYTTRARLRTTPCNAPECTNFNQSLQENFYSGTLTTTLNSARSVTGFAVEGGLPGAFGSGSTMLYNESHSWQMQGTRTIRGFADTTSAISGTVRAFGTGATLQGTLALRDGSNLVTTPVGSDETEPGADNPVRGGTASSGALNLAWTTPDAEFDGLLSLTDSVWDSSGTSLAPQRAELTGSRRTVVSGVASEFLRGSFVLALSGYDSHDATLPYSTTNRYNESATFAAAVTAPNRPRLEITIGASKTSDLPEPGSLTLQYRSLVGGTPRIVIGATATRDANGLGVYSLTEASANLRMEWRETDATSDLFQGALRVGTLNNSTGLLTFVDGSFISIDAGL